MHRKNEFINLDTLLLEVHELKKIELHMIYSMKGRDFMDNIITLNNEFGEEVKFEFLDLIRHEDAEYVVLLPVGDDEEIGEVVILQLETCDEEADEETFIGVNDEFVLTEVYSIFMERHKDEYDFMEVYHG